MMKNKIGVFLFLFIFISFNIFSDNLFTDIPPDHWSRAAVRKLKEEGILEGFADGTFRGDEVITRYEIAVILAKILERLERVEESLSQVEKPKKQEKTQEIKLSPEAKKSLDNLIEEFKPELEALKTQVIKLETKTTELEKDIKKQETEAKKRTTEEKKKEGERKKEISSLKKDISFLQLEQGRILFSGESNLTIKNTDYFAKGMLPTSKFEMGDDHTIGGPDRSVVDTAHSLSINFKASPSQTVRTDKTIEVKTGFEINYDEFGKKYWDGDSWETWRPGIGLKDLTINYSAPRRKFRGFSMGHTSAGWSFLSLGKFGVSFQGVKLESQISSKLSGTGILAKMAEAGRPYSESEYMSGKGVPRFSEYLYGFSLNTTYKGSNELGFYFLRNYQDPDSMYVPKSEMYKSSKIPDENNIYALFTSYKLTPAITIRGEYAISDYRKYRYAPYIKLPKAPTPDEPDYNIEGGVPLNKERTLWKMLNVPKATERDFGMLLWIDYNKKNFNLMSLYYRQNPNYHNRYGGVLSLLSLAGSGLSLGGIDIGSMVAGLQALILWPTYNPPWAKGMQIKCLYLTGGEIEPSKLSELMDDLGETAGVTLKPDPDYDKRKSKLKLTFLWPQISYRPGVKTTFSFEAMYANAGFDRDVVRGIYGVPGISLNPPNQSLPNKTDPYVQWPDPTTPTGFREIFVHIEPGKDYIQEIDYSTGALKSPQYVNLSGGGSVYLNVPDNPGEYMYEDGKLKKIIDKPLYLKFKYFSPQFKINHDFSKKLKYAFTYKIDFMKPDEACTLAGSNLAGLLKFAIKSEKTTKIENKFTYLFLKDITMEFIYTIEKRKMFYHTIEYFVDGHREKRQTVEFKLNFKF
jgi:hypothetical protein